MSQVFYDAQTETLLGLWHDKQARHNAAFSALGGLTPRTGDFPVPPQAHWNEFSEACEQAEAINREVAAHLNLHGPRVHVFT